MDQALYEQAKKDVADAEKDIEADGHDWDTVAHDVIPSVILGYPDDVRREILRTELGLGIFPDDPDPLGEYPY